MSTRGAASDQRPIRMVVACFDAFESRFKDIPSDIPSAAPVLPFGVHLGSAPASPLKHSPGDRPRAAFLVTPRRIPQSRLRRRLREPPAVRRVTDLADGMRAGPGA